MSDSTKRDAALVTGGGNGMGRDIALKLAELYPTVIVGRDSTGLQETVALAAGKANAVIPVVGDLTHPATLASIQSSLDAEGLEVAALVLNAAVWRTAPFESTSTLDVESMLRVNAFAPLELIRVILPGMKAKKRGTIVFNAGAVGIQGFANNVAYCASKFAQVGAAQALAAENKKFGLTITALVSTYVEGERTDLEIAAMAKSRSISLDDARAKLAAAMPQKRLIPPTEIAEIVASLCTGGMAAVKGNPLVLGA